MTPDLDDSVLLISAPRSGAGGLFVLDQGSVVAIDRVATQGLSAREGRLARIISSGRVATPCGDVLVYDRSGLRRSYRVDGLGNMHDALYADDALLIVNTAGNAVEALHEDGSVTTWWQGPPRFDAWHVNCLFSDGGSVVATAFGRGARSSAWRDANGTDGVIIRIPDETVLVSGLDKPHDPRRIDGLWVVCQSGKSQLLGFDDEGRLQKSRDLGGFTRGLAFDADHLFVGESRMRQSLGGERWSRVNVLERESWNVVDSFEVPVPEIYAIARVPRALAEGVRRSENPLASLGARFVGLGWGVTDLVPAGSRRFTIEASVPSTLVANTHLKLSCRLTNHSDVPIGTFGPYPVDLSYRWDDDDGLPVRQAIRFDLSQDLAPGESCDVEAIVAAPDRCGTFRLTLFLTQAEIAWSNALSTESAESHEVTIVEGTPVVVSEVLAPSAAATGTPARREAGAEVRLAATGHGVVSLADGRVIDPLPTLSLRREGELLYRSIAGAEPGTFDLIVYDRRGAVEFRRGEGTAVAAGAESDAAVVVPDALARGLETGFRTNPTRVREEAHLARFRRLNLEPVTVWASAGSLWPAAMAVGIEAVVPRTMTAGATVPVAYRVENRGNGWIVPGKPNPVAVSYRWYDDQGKQAGRDATSVRTPLPRTLAPGDALSSTLSVLAPKRSGRFRLTVTLVQEFVGWFSDVSEASGFSTDVDVTER